MLSAEALIEKYYPADDALRRLLLVHSRQVAERATSVCRRHPELGLDADFVRRAAMLHDIGIFLTDAPGIFCYGSAPYMLHGYLGAQIMRREGDEAVARVCERHTGTGLTPDAIRTLGLDLPPGIYTPQTLEEKLVCYADKFYSKSHPERERTPEQTAQSLAKFGDANVDIFLGWHALFG